MLLVLLKREPPERLQVTIVWPLTRLHLGMIPTLASVPFPARFNMHTKFWNLLALLLLLTLGGPSAFASEADELRVKAIAIKKEAAALAERGERERAEQLERQAQELLQAAQQREAATREPGDRPAAHELDQQIHRLKEHLQSLLGREHELRDRRAPERQLAEVREQIAQAERRLHELHGHALPGKELPPELHEQAERLQDAMRRVHHVRVAADNLRAAGMLDLAAELTERAGAMERDAQQAKERLAIEMKRRAELVAAEHEPKASVESKLLEEIERLRAEVRELRQRIEQR
jgi:hypothetical protein